MIKQQYLHVFCILVSLSSVSYAQETSDYLNDLKIIEKESVDFLKTLKENVEFTYQLEQEKEKNKFDDKIKKIENDQKKIRDEAILKFENILKIYPNDVEYVPDAMFRLSELYYERSYENYLKAQDEYDKKMILFQENPKLKQPDEPYLSYQDTIEMMEKLVYQFPTYRHIDSAYYLLGYCYSEQGEEELAYNYFYKVVQNYPDSRFLVEVWMRIGEYKFALGQLKEAIQAYEHVFQDPESVYYDKALYKAAWSHYRLADSNLSPFEYQKAVNLFVRLLDLNEATKKKGQERGADLKAESIQYIAITYSEEQWGGVGKLADFFDSIGRKDYEYDIFVTLSDLYLEQTRYQEAAQTFQKILERWPLHNMAPLIHERYAAMLEKLKMFESAFAEREKIEKTYRIDSTWSQENKNSIQAMNRAQDILKRNFYATAAQIHREAQKLRQENSMQASHQKYERASYLYGRYLENYPHDKNRDNILYYQAECAFYAQEYIKSIELYRYVADHVFSLKVKEDAAFSEIVASEFLYQEQQEKKVIPQIQVLKNSDRINPLSIEEKPLFDIQKSFIHSIEHYYQLFPKNSKASQVLYKKAEVLYSMGHFDEAVDVFKKIIQEYPETETSRYAANMIVESYLGQNRYDRIAEFSKSILDSKIFDKENDFKKSISKFRVGSLFKLAEQLSQNQKYEESAEMYLKLVDEFSNDEFADAALNNAAVALEKVKRYDSAAKIYERLAKEKPKSPFADGAWFRVGLNAERFFNFDKAVEAYLAVGDLYPNSDKRADAIYNAALALENMQNYEQSAKQYEKYCYLFQESQDTPQICFKAGLVFEKGNNFKSAFDVYMKFIERYKNKTNFQDKMIEAYLKLGNVKYALNQKEQAYAFYKQAIDLFKLSPSPVSALFAAEAHFKFVEKENKFFTDIVIDGDTKQQKKKLTDKAESLKKVTEAYQAVLSYKQMEYTLASLFKIGKLYQDFSEKLMNAPCPADVKKSASSMGATVEEVCDEYKVLLEEKAADIEDKAVSAFETTMNKAREFQVANTWTKQTLVVLNQLRKNQWPMQQDALYSIQPSMLKLFPIIDHRANMIYPTKRTP